MLNPEHHARHHLLHGLIKHHAQRTHINPPARGRIGRQKLNLLWRKQGETQIFSLIVDPCANRKEFQFASEARNKVNHFLSAEDGNICLGIFTKNLHNNGILINRGSVYKFNKKYAKKGRAAPR